MYILYVHEVHKIIPVSGWCGITTLSGCEVSNEREISECPQGARMASWKDYT